jgi:signal transduction histidine kinase/DNA-binding response OmpR family regulator/HPt (histidine-containing phosphotransfer) domain-containing protein
MQWFRHSSINNKLQQINFAVSLAVVVTATTIYISNHIVTYRSSLIDTLVSVGSVVAANSKAPLLFDDKGVASETLDTMTAVPYVRYAAIVDSNGDRFGEYKELDQAGMALINKDLAAGTAQRSTGELTTIASDGWLAEVMHLFSTDDVIVTLPIAHDTEHLGTLYIVAELSPLISQVKWFLVLAGLVLLVSLGLSWLIANSLFKAISKPLCSLTRLIRNISRTGDYCARDIPHSGDEVGELVVGFIDMLGKIKDRDDKLATYSQQLQADVAERTVELLNANTALEETIEEMRQAKERAEEASRAKSVFLATMSHEIRTPMNGVLGMIELLLGSKLSEQQQRFAETVRRSGETLLGIINDILDFSKIEAGKLSLEEANFSLRDLIDDLGQLFSARAHAKGLELACSVPSDIPEEVMGDVIRLRQILTNLVGNAIKFTSAGEVLISVQLLKETATLVHVRFAIKDTGIGLKPSQIDHIFDSFAQADGSTTRKYGGTGLGLTISRQLVGLMGGQLDVESVAGQGSTFSFELKLKKQQKNLATSSAQPVKDFSKLHVLVVDDNTTNLEILSHHLEAWNIKHSCAESGSSALQLLHAAVATSTPYNMVILDYHMPEMDGLELARMIHTDPLLSCIRMVMFSSVDDAVLQQNDVGIDYSITKPVRQSDLYDCMINRNVADYRSKDHGTNDKYPLMISDPASMQILVVEDNEVNQAVAIGMLKKLGYRGIHSANNGREALDKVEQTHYDLIFMDMQMPVMDGYQATAALRQREQALAVDSDDAAIPHTPVIALTANAMQGDREHCLEAGADDYLSKPFSPIDLRKLLEKWLPYSGSRDVAATRAATQVETHLPDILPKAGKRLPLESAESAIDQSVLDTIRDMADEDDPDMLAEIIGLYLDKAPELLQALQSAVTNNDAESLRIAAHTLKSSSANLGARVLADLCKELEVMGRSQSLDNSAAKLSLLHHEYRRVDSALSDELKGNAA